jgi:hypothetical protein
MYKLTNSTNIIRADGASIPNDPSNTDYTDYLNWLSEGNLPEVADEPLPLTYQQLRALAYPPLPEQFDLIFHGGLDAWKAAIIAVKTKYPKS